MRLLNILFSASCCLVVVGCESFLDVDLTKSLTPAKEIFADDLTADAAISGMYHDMVYTPYGFASGDGGSVVTLAGLSSDELLNFAASPEFIQFEQNVLLPDNSNVQRLWSTIYNSIYQANAVIEGVRASTGVTADVRRQLEGEARFVRAFCYYYLVNFFGEVPLVTQTDYRVTSLLPRTKIDVVYDTIIGDAQRAESLLAENYTTEERVRPNKFAAIALLARVYLVRGEWANAAAHASLVIDAKSLYRLPTDLDSVFLKNSPESIWQLFPVIPSRITNEAMTFVIVGWPQNNILQPSLLTTFEADDIRAEKWIGAFDMGEGVIVYYPYKYKRVEELNEYVEYSMVLRLAEQYLIRAEAYAHLNDFPRAIADVDAIRHRAGISLLADTDPDIGEEELLLTISHERRVELFAEWGHRWIDLKRMGLADTELSTLKPSWSPEDVLYPIPQQERNSNTHLGEQNPGY
jgi:starch-binding outer membrane protein, SusD/RagB family